jgi:hypothetical protein
MAGSSTCIPPRRAFGSPSGERENAITRREVLALLVHLVHLVVILIFFSLFLQFVLVQRIVDIYICIWSLPFDQAQGVRLH